MTVATADEDDDADNCGNDDEEEEEENTDENAGDEPDGEDLATLPLRTELASNNLTISRKWSSMIKMITVDNDCRDD